MLEKPALGGSLGRDYAALVGLLGVLLGGMGQPVSGQSPLIQTVDVKGWVPAARVAPSIRVDTFFNSTRKLWIYTYRVRNQPTASQSLIKLALILSVSVESAEAPDGWVAVTYSP